MSTELTFPEEATLKYYDTTAEKWVTDHSDPNFWKDELALFHELLPNGRIIEIGAGGGRDAQRLIEWYQYVGIEPSLELYKKAAALNPKGLFSAQTVYDLNFPRNMFDGFWASAVLLHIPRQRIKEALGRIHLVTRNKGVGFISIKQGSGAQIETERINSKTLERLFVYYQPEEFQQVLEDSGFGILTTQVKPMSERTTWLNYFVEVQK